MSETRRSIFEQNVYDTMRRFEAQQAEARKAARQEISETEKQTKLLEEIRTILARLLAIAEYKAPRS